MKKILLLITSIMATYSIVHAVSPVDGACNVNGAGVIEVPAADSYCKAEPDFYGITVYEMGLCTAQPTAPLVGTEIDLTNCVVVYTDAGGSAVEVIKNGSSAMNGGTTNRPPSGTYNYAYLKISKNFSIKAAITFDGAMQDDPSGINVGDAISTGIYCYTTGVTSTGNGNDGNNNYLPSSECSNIIGDLAKAQTNTAPLEEFGGNGFVGSYTQGTMTAYLVDSSNFLATDSADALNLVGIRDYTATPIIVTDASTSMNVQFTVSEGMSVNDVSGPSGTQMLGIGNGPFDIVITVD